MWRNREDRNERSSRWSQETLNARWANRDREHRIPVWESVSSGRSSRSSSPRHRERYDRDRNERTDRCDRRYDRDREYPDREFRDRRDRLDREVDRYRRDRDRRDRDRDRSRESRRSPHHYDGDSLAAPSPPHISVDMEIDRKSQTSNDSDRQVKDEYEKTHEKADENQHSMNASAGDWICKCGLYNFKRRQVCYRRNCQGTKSDGVIYGGDPDKANVAGITKHLLFRRLDALTTEENILDALKERCTKPIIDSISGITVGRETLTGASKCLAYINFNSVADSTAAYSELMHLKPPLKIDGREVLINFYNDPQKPSKPSTDYSNYYNMQMSTYTQALSETDRVNAAAAVAQSAISAVQARQMSWAPVASVTPVLASPVVTQVAPADVPTGDGKTVYKAPDVRTFMYDETSGFYYDPATGLYYDGYTQYFYNSKANQYMYWDGTSSTYIAVAHNNQSERQSSTSENVTKEPEEKKKKDKEDKVKVAKKIAKDMERWAKTLNQKKENARSNIVAEQILDTGTSKGSADIGFSVLGAGPSLITPAHVREISPPPVIPTEEDFLMKKSVDIDFDNDDGIIDWPKLTCLLCKRKFPSADVLNKHKTMSDLHKANLMEVRRKNDALPQNNGYRDRAAERRMKFGEDDPPPIRKRYEPSDVPMPPVQSHPPPSVVDTIGGKMLQKMGWSEGKGLGKTEQGRIAPIEAEQRPVLAGLGQKRGIYTPTPGETYRDTVKKLMIARYKEVVGQEDTSK